MLATAAQHPPSSAAITQQDQQTVFDYLHRLQTTLATQFAAADNTAPAPAPWQSDLGTGIAIAFHGGDLFERGGVNFSRIAGARLPPAASARHPQLAGRPYLAGGVSVVMHPKNPYCPTAHLNVRFFCADQTWWFGGGMDLTPYYAFADDCRHFHQTCKTALDQQDPALYPQFKKNCDDYFYIRHRNEPRGIGGVFFDDFNQRDFPHAFAVASSVGDAFLPAYLPLLQKRRATPYGARQRDWQKHRRGRYVEFNLVYDRGTLFGLQSGGRADAILMSLPPAVCWGTPAHPPTTEETALQTDFLPPQDWCA